MTWQIIISDFMGGFASKYYAEGFPSFGNKNQAGAMLNADLTNPGGLQQGPGLSTLTAGTEAGAVTTLIRSILDLAVTSDTTYGVGGNKLQKISSSAVTNSGIWPHTIDKAAVTGETGEDVIYYRGNLYYSYNYGSAGDIGKFDLTSTFTDAWGSVVPSGAAALQNAPHPMVVGGDELYIGNGRYLASWDEANNVFQAAALTFEPGFVVKAVAFMSDKVWIAASLPNVSGTNKNRASIFIWDGVSSTFDTEIRVMGSVGGLHVKNGTMYIFYQDVSNIGGFKMAYINGTSVVDIANFSGGLPTFYQITDYKDFIIWNTTSLNALWSQTSFPWQMVSPWTTTTGDDLIYAFGSGDKDLPARFFQFADSGYTTAGAVSAPFGTPMIASNQSTSYKLAQFSGYDVNSNWKSLMFDITGQGKNGGSINEVRINFDQLATGARVDWKLLNSRGETIYTDIISYTKLGAKTSAYYPLAGLVQENFRLEFDYSSGSTSNTVKIRNVKIYGSN